MLGVFLAWERTLSGPSVATTVGVVVCAVVAVFSVGVTAVCALYETGSGNDQAPDKMYAHRHRK